MRSIFDMYFYFMGDEDTNVGVHCRHCETGGLPVIFYSTEAAPPFESDGRVRSTDSISDMLTHMRDHLAQRHPETQR